MSNEFKVKSKIKGSYSVEFIEDLDKLLKGFLLNQQVKFLIDDNVLKLFKSKFEILQNTGRLISIESNEKNKTIEYSQLVIRELISINVRVDDTLIAIGGGITQDIVAFISSIIFRGVNWVFVPTTLLAQCDSCIGSKSSINFDSYKNLLGTFNPPTKIYIYKGFLDTLTESEIRSGIGEMLHYFFTVGNDLAIKLTDEIPAILKDRKKLDFFIKNSLIIKKNIIEIDEFDQSIRHIFNYGHTFGHALEALTNYAIPHGQAITIGMDLANYISFQKKFIDEMQFDALHEILIKNIPKFKFDNFSIDNYLNALSKDKKNKDNKIGCILYRSIGKVEKVFVENDIWFRNTLINYFKKYN